MKLRDCPSGQSFFAYTNNYEFHIVNRKQNSYNLTSQNKS